MAQTIFMKDGTSEIMFGSDHETVKFEFARILRERLGPESETEFLHQMDDERRCQDCSLCDPSTCEDLCELESDKNELRNALQAVEADRDRLERNVDEYKSVIETTRALLRSMSAHAKLDGHAAYLLQQAYNKLNDI